VTAHSERPADNRVPAAAANSGEEALAQELLDGLFPLCRSITGDDVRRSLAILSAQAPFTVHEIPSGTTCYDWIVPDEWRIRAAYIETPSGERIADFSRNNLHVVNYSAAIRATMSFAELQQHLHTLPDRPRAIPYRTAYYQRDWGFCLTHEELLRLPREGAYRVTIDAEHFPGAMSYGERTLHGSSPAEFLIHTYCCHPSLGNDNLSGMVLWTLLLREMSQRTWRHSYRFVIAPETIGAIAYLQEHSASAITLSGGLLMTTVAGPGVIGMKRSFHGDSLVDRATRTAFAALGKEPLVYPFDINGSDEKHWSAPAFRIPIVTICKDKYYSYGAYHTSDDDLSFISATALCETLAVYRQTIAELEAEEIPRSRMPWCEPMLGIRGLYQAIGGAMRPGQTHGAARPDEQALADLRWVMFLSDGRTSLSMMAERLGIGIERVRRAASRLEEHGLLEKGSTACA